MRINHELAELKILVESWRKGKKTRAERMPEGLRKKVENAARKCGVGRASSLLKVNSFNLRRQITKQKTSRCPAKPSIPKVVRLAPINIGSGSWSANAASQVPSPGAIVEGYRGVKVTFFSPLDSSTLSTIAAMVGGRE